MRATAITERSLEVLRVIVEDYVSLREPVGSKHIASRHPFGVSAATIRNDMAALEEADLIAAPHTSSGRVPTDKGYRLFVDRLTEVRPLTRAQRNAIEAFLEASTDLDDVFARSVRLLAQLTNQLALVQYPNPSRSNIRHIEFVPVAPRRVLVVLITDTGSVEQNVAEITHEVADDELADLRARLNARLAGHSASEATAVLRPIAEDPDESRPLRREIAAVLLEQLEGKRQDRLVVAGTANLVRIEQDFTSSLSPVLEAIEEQVVLLRLFDEMATDARSVAASIGRENEAFGLEETSVLTSGYSASEVGPARLGVLGPTRMDYSANMGAVRAVARYLTRLLGEA